MNVDGLLFRHGLSEKMMIVLNTNHWNIPFWKGFVTPSMVQARVLFGRGELLTLPRHWNWGFKVLSNPGICALPGSVGYWIPSPLFWEYLDFRDCVYHRSHFAVGICKYLGKVLNLSFLAPVVLGLLALCGLKLPARNVRLVEMFVVESVQVLSSFWSWMSTMSILGFFSRVTQDTIFVFFFFFRSGAPAVVERLERQPSYLLCPPSHRIGCPGLLCLLT